MAERAIKTGLAKQVKLNATAGHLSSISHFTIDECKGLLRIHESMAAIGKVDRLRFRDFVNSCFDITDGLMLDFIFRAFDRNSDQLVDEAEFVIGLSNFLRGSIEELIETCYFIYDMNGDGGLAREELSQCLKGCIIAGYGVENDELEDAEKEMIEIAMKKLDSNKDGQITFEDFREAVLLDPLLIVACGPCLPNPQAIASFLSTISEDYRSYTGNLNRLPKSNLNKKESTLARTKTSSNVNHKYNHEYD